jgi:hypothetical protein
MPHVSQLHFSAVEFGWQNAELEDPSVYSNGLEIWEVKCFGCGSLADLPASRAASLVVFVAEFLIKGDIKMKSALSNLRIRVPAAAAGFLLALAGSSVVRGQATDTKLRWDLIVVTFRAPAAPNILSPGGADSATATDIAGSPRLRITLTGSGTFTQWDPTDVTGGGTYAIADLQGKAIDSGTYTVTQLVSWALDGVFPPAVVNNVTGTTGSDFRSGIAVFRIAFSDGSKGTLVVSCNLPGGSPDPYEGISVIKGKVHFQVPDPVRSTADTNRTIFTALSSPLIASPNPIIVAGGGAFGMTTITWVAPDAQAIEIHIGSPNGELFATGGRTGSAQTGPWVTDGMTFYLQDVTGGKPLTSANTLARLVVHVQRM